MSAFRMFVKSATDLGGRAIANFPLISGRFGDDCQSIYTSSFVALDVPGNIEAGDFCGVYDSYGKIVYAGIIQVIKGSNIEAKPIISLFDFQYIAQIGTAASGPNVEPQIIAMLNQLMGIGGVIGDIMNWRITMTAGTNTPGGTVLINPNDDLWEKPFNMMDMLRTQENAYGIHYYWTLPYEPGKLLLNISTATAAKVTVSDNVACVYNMNIGEEEPVYNMLIAMVVDTYNRSKKIYYLLKDGTYANGVLWQWETLAFHKVMAKTAYYNLADWEDLETVKKEIPPLIHNQGISFDMVIENNFYDFSTWQLGQEMEIWLQGKYYETVYTAWEMEFTDGQPASIVHITCGTARTKLTEVLNAEK